MTGQVILAGWTSNDSQKESDCRRNVLPLCSICLWRFHKRHTLPQETFALIDRSFLNDKMKRTYKRVIEERRTRFGR